MAPAPPPSPLALGVAVGPDTVDAVALRSSGGSVVVVGRYVRQRSGAAEAVGAEALALAVPGLRGSDDADYTLEVGDGSSGASPFLPSEFGLSGSGGAAAGVASSTSRPFAPQLRDILAEVGAAGLTVDRVAFVVGHPDAAAVVLPVPDGSDKARRAGRGGAADQKRLVALLEDRHAGGVDPARTAFVPMAPADGRDRVLGVTVDPSEPVAATLQTLAERGHPLTVPVSLDVEAAALADLVRAGSPAAEAEVAALVRVGTEDTLFLVFEGGRVLHAERLRSLTAYDLPDTVASRVLLQFDQKKVGAVQTLFVSVAGRHEPLLEKFRALFPDAAVERAAVLLAGAGVEVDAEDDADELKAGPLAAGAAALAALADGGPARDLLPPVSHARRRVQTAPLVLTVLAALVLVGVLAVGVVRYLDARAEVQEIEAELLRNPPVLPTDSPDLLQARVDSLNRAYTTYTRALDVLDSLLLGSDQWTQAMRLTTRTVESTGGTWFMSWAPDPPYVRVTGQALGRPQVVELARRLRGTIEMLEYTDVGSRRVYTFDMLMPVDAETPEVSRFLRRVAAEGAASMDSLEAAAAADAASYATNPGRHDH